MRAYEAITAWAEANPELADPFVLTAHRRMGKSFLFVLIGIGRCLANPGYVVRYGAPTEKDCVEIVVPLIRQLLQFCPRELRPQRAGRTWRFQNPRSPEGSLPAEFILFGGAREAEDQRGKASNMVILDEARLMKNLEAMIEEIFAWHFAGQEKPLFVIGSTPPKKRHAFSTVEAQAFREDRGLKIRTIDNADWTERDDKIVVKICHGKGTPAYKREALCETIYDSKFLVIPEMKDPQVVSEVVVDHYDRPPYFFPLVAGDFGWSDYTAILFMYVHFEKQLLVVEDELVVHHLSTGMIAQKLREKEAELYGPPEKPTVHHLVSRVADHTAQGLDDWNRDQLIPFQAAEDRHDPDNLCAELRTLFYLKKIRIVGPKCPKLLFQLENGIRDERGKFERSDDEQLGHLDAIAALMYGRRAVSFEAIPLPKESPRDFEQMHSLPPQDPKGCLVRRIMAPVYEAQPFVNAGQRKPLVSGGAGMGAHILRSKRFKRA